MTAETPPTATPTEASLLVAFTRMETKVDVVLGQHGTKLDDHEARLRKVEDLTSKAVDADDHEKRIREVEARKTVSPVGLLSAVAGGAGLLLVVTQLLDRFFPIPLP
jgi:GTPase